MKKIKPKPKPITTTKQAHDIRHAVQSGRIYARAIIKAGYELDVLESRIVFWTYGKAFSRSYNKVIRAELLRRSIAALEAKSKNGFNHDGCSCKQYGPDCGIC